MAKKIDGVIEAVRYARNGQIELVRAYERRGFTFSDWILLDRNDLLSRINDGKSFVTGQRKELWASTFDVGKVVFIVNVDGKQFLATHQTSQKRDELEGTPVF